MHSSKNRLLPQSSPELSVIVPILNEAAMLPQLFVTLQQQQGVDFELLLVDGGSDDASPALAQQLAREAPFACRMLGALAGRGAQMNAGAAAARGAFLLFLHVDSTFNRPDALSVALTALRAAIAGRGDERKAGRFALRFARGTLPEGGHLAFHEAKARINRPGCIHGDQGFLLPSAFFAVVGPFDETLPFLEDDRLAARVFEVGEWLCLPAEIVTSGRRFAAEGVRQRQILNLLILTLDALGEEELLCSLPELYRRQGRTGRLRLAPFFAAIDAALAARDCAERRAFWRRAGGFLRVNCWQIALLLALWRQQQHAFANGESSPLWLVRYDRRPVGGGGAAGGVLAALMAWGGYRILRTYGKNLSGNLAERG